MGKYKKLLTPTKIGSMELKNRMAMAPMSLNLNKPGGYVTKKTVDYFAERAKGGVALIFTDATQVDGRYITDTFFDPEFKTEEHIECHRKLTEAVHQHGGKIMPELAHAGPLAGKEPIGPSNTINPLGGTRIREMTVEEIEEAIGIYGIAAGKAKEAGYDGVMLHMAHALMLPGWFLSPMRNKRTDSYGGNVDGRMKFPLEIISEIRKTCGKDFPIVVRMSGDEIMEEGNHLMDAVWIAKKFESAGVDALEISGGASPEYLHWCIPLLGTKHGINADFAAEIKKHIHIPVLTVGRITSPDYAESILEAGKADMVVLGRALLADPEFPKKVRDGRVDEINQCVGCGDGCSAMNFKIPGCVINPRAGDEAKLNIKPAKVKKKVVVVGGGLSGMQAAADAAERGHDVVMFEKEARLGGVVNYGLQPPLKQELTYWIKDLKGRVEKAGVKIRMNMEATKETVLAEKPDAVIVATGSTPIWPKVEGLTHDNAVLALDVLDSKKGLFGGRHLVVGGGMVGLETADFIAKNNEYAYMTGENIHVTVIEMLPRVAADCVPQNWYYRMNRLKKYGVEILVNTKLIKVGEDGVIVEKDGTLVNLGKFDGIVIACGMKSQNSLAEELRNEKIEVKVVGDAIKPRQALYATREGAVAAAEL